MTERIVSGPTIYVDADACPVKAEILRAAERQDLDVVLVAASGLRPSRDRRVRVVLAGDAFDAADDEIVRRIGAGDLCITSDMPLAGRVVDKGAIALTPKGRLLDARNVGDALAARDLSQHLREASQGQTYNAPYGKADRSAFLQGLDRAVRLLRRQADSGA